ncbi:MAG: vWA domain-containing protein, partial [Gemmataceae bacterium]
MPPRVNKGLWFPLSLAALAALTLPGAALLGLSLSGLEGPVNARLQSAFNLSYHNPLPPWAAVALFLIPPALLLLYFLKLRRQALVVPSTLLWRKSIEDLRVNSLFQWLRDNVLLLVQLCVVLLLIYAALAFQVHGGRASDGRHYILLIDSSASMSATDVAPSRLEAARAEALREIDGRADTDAGMVIEFNSRASILQPYTRDKGLLRAAVRRVTQTQRPTRIDEALTLADSLANPRRSTDNEAVRPDGEDPAEARQYVAADGIAADVHLYSDGRFPDVPNFAAGNLSLHYHRAGAAGLENAFNAGIVTLNAVRDEKDPSKLLVYARVMNFGKERAEPVLELRWGDANLKDAALSIPGRFVDGTADRPEEASHTFELPDIDEASDVVIHARLMRRSAAGVQPWRDQFALDDEAWLVAGVVRKARVLIVSAGNDILATFFGLDETAKVAAVTTIAPAELRDEAKYLRPARAGEYDLVIFDRCAPPSADAQPLANAWYIDAVPPGLEKAKRPLAAGAVIQNQASAHPLMRHLTGLNEIAFTGGFRFDLRAEGVPPRVPRLLEADRETALLFALPRRAFTDLVLTFPLVNDAGQWTTNWNLKLSFPVFLRNVL